ncbi:MAG: T9SS type A sorting domain-containing protein [Candidatus Marinimicrobia bacterium]|nr:T9SS type A sorting domain-containing protein [Candidatus Neomarinimicrobiota bacterium]
MLILISSGTVFSATRSITFANQASIAGSMGPGTTENGMLEFTLQEVGNGGASSWTALTVRLTGNVTSTQVTSVSIWRNAGTLGWLGTGDDTFLASSTFSGSQPTVTSTITLSERPPSTATYYYVVFDIASGTTAADLAGAEITASTSFTTNGTFTTTGATFPFTSGDQSLPVELGSWTATSSDGSVELQWITESEIENQGFIIERKAENDIDYTEIASFITDPELQGQGSTTERTIYGFTDKNVNVGETYIYRLADVDYISAIVYHAEISVTVRSDDELQLPGSMCLNDAYPNPFNPLVNLGFRLEEAAEISLSIYDVQGREIATIVEGYYHSGNYSFQWDGTSSQGEVMASGVYLVRLTAADNHQTQKITIVR